MPGMFGMGRLALLSTAGAVASLGTPLPQAAALVARWSADDIPAQADNTALSSWTAGVGGSTATLSASSTGTPKYRTNVFGGKPGVQFTGTQSLDAGRPAAMVSAMNGQAYTMMALVSNVSTKANGTAFGNSSSSGVLLMADGARAGIFPTATTGFPYTGSAPVMIGYSGYPSAATLGSTSIGSLIYLNGSAVWGYTAAPTSGSADFGIGGFAPFNFGLIGYVHEVLMWNVSLSPADILQVQKWWCDKYAQPYPWAASGIMDIMHGDSITHGQNASAPEWSYPSYVAAMNNRPLGSWTNLGFSGTTWDQMRTITSPFVDAIPGIVGSSVKCRLACFEWYNQKSTDGVSARTSATTYLANRKAANPNMKIIFGTSTDENYDAAGSAMRQGRDLYDQYWDVAANRANIDVYVPIHNNQYIGVDGAAANTTYFESAGVHPTGVAGYPTTPSGYGVLASLFAPAIASI